MAAVLAACGGTAETGNYTALEITSSGSAEMVEELEAESVTGTGEPEMVTIYYGSSVGKELSTEEVEVPRKTPDAIIGELRKKNIVSVDTKVNDFTVSEDREKLTLDLSAGFRDYLKTMEEGSEAVIMAALTNSFLAAYDAQEMVVTINGQRLETKNRVYEEGLRFVDMLD